MTTHNANLPFTTAVAEIERTDAVDANFINPLFNQLLSNDKRVMEKLTDSYSTNVRTSAFFRADGGAHHDRQILLFGDSHGWGEGSPNYQGASAGYSIHAAWIHNNGFMDRLREHLYKKWNSEPWRCIPLLGPDATVGFTNATKVHFGSKKAKKVTLKDTYTISPRITKGRYIAYSWRTPDMNAGPGNTALQAFIDAWTRNDSYAVSAYTYNAHIGLLTSTQLELAPDIDRVNDDFVHVTPWASIPGTAGWNLLANKCGGVHSDGTAFITLLGRTTVTGIDAPSGTIPDWVKAGNKLYIPELGTVKISSVAAYPEPNGDRLNVFIKDNDDTNITLATMQALVYPGMKVYRSIAGESCMLVDLPHPTRYVTIHLYADTFAAKAKIELLHMLDHSDGTDEYTDGTVDSFGDQFYGNAAPTVYILADPTNKYGGLSPATNAVVTASSITIDPTAVTNHCYYIIDFKQKKEGTLRISHAGAGVNTVPARRGGLGLTSVVATKGLLLGNRDLVRNWSMGGHTIGSWLGQEASYWGETRNHVADAVAYMNAAIQSIVVEAPLVNEHIKQTPLATFKQRFTDLAYAANTGSVLIFTTLGEKSYEFGTDPGPITYEQYAQAVKEWADASRGQVTFIDCRGYLKSLAAAGYITADDLYINNGHPSPLANEVMAKMLIAVADMKF